MKSLLFQNTTPFVEPAECGVGRKEVEVTLRKDGRLYRYKLRDKIAPEDPYFVLVRAAAFALQTGEPYNGTPPSRAVRDYLVKSNIVI